MDQREGKSVGKSALVVSCLAILTVSATAYGVPAEPVWPTVVPEYYDYAADPASQMKGAYFSAKYVSTPDTVKYGTKVLLRRRFVLKEKPIEAHFQGTGEFWFTYKLNGAQILRARATSDRSSRDWVYSVDSLPQLKAGENLLEADYSVEEGKSGAILAELFVRYADGSVEKVLTDNLFESSSDDGKTWKGVVEAPPAPTVNRVTRLNYTDYDHPQKVLSGPGKIALKGGEKTTLAYVFAGIPPKGEFFVRLKLFKGGRDYWFEEINLDQRHVKALSDGTWRLEIPYEAPLYFASANYRLAFQSNSIWCREGSMDVEMALTAQNDPAYPHPVRAEMTRRNGRLQLTLDGKPAPALWGALQQYVRPDRKAHHSDMPLTGVVLMPVYYGWYPKLGETDFGYFDMAAECFRREHPGAYFIIDLTIYPPQEFAEKFPEEMSLDDAGERYSAGRFAWSFASRVAMDEMKKTVEAAVRYLEKTPYANRIIAYRVNSGLYTEWIGWAPRDMNRSKDLSQPNTRAYLEYVSARHPEIVHPHVPVTSERRELDSTYDILWDQRKHANVVAYNNYYSWIVAQDILEFAGLVKRTLADLGRQKLFGTYYGYTHYQNFRGHEQNQAHGAVDTLIAENDGRVDFLCSPQCYFHGRNFGETCADMKAFGSLNAAGIMPIVEDDTRTHARLYPEYSPSCHGALNGRQTRALLVRNSGIALCRNLPFYLYAISTGVDFSCPEATDVGRDLRKVMDFTLERTVQRKAEVAVVVSERSVMALPEILRQSKSGERLQAYNAQGVAESTEIQTGIFNGEIFTLAHNRFARAGAPVDYVLAEDLKRHPGEYRLYVFMNLFTCDAETRAVVAKLRERGATMLWLYAPGYLNGNTIDAMKDLTGIPFASCQTAGDARVRIVSDGRMMGTPDAPVARRFYPAKPDVVLGTYEDGNPGLAAVKVGQSLNFFSGAWQLDQQFLSFVYRKSGVHVYADSDDPVEANTSFFTLHARHPGHKTIRLPRKVAVVVDVFAHKIVARDTDVFSFDAPIHSSYLFYFGSDAGKLASILSEKGEYVK